MSRLLATLLTTTLLSLSTPLLAADNPRVLTDPEPLLFFLTFGASTLDHELRVHVRELGDRNAAIDEINREIDRRFREQGIEIAFNQMDVHIRSIADGREALLQSTPAVPPAPTCSVAPPLLRRIAPPSSGPPSGAYSS